MAHEPAAPAFRAARLAVAGSALIAPLAHAFLLGPHVPLAWLSIPGLALGAAGGVLAPARTAAALLAIAPLWQVAMALATGTTDLHLVMPWLAALAACLVVASPRRWLVHGRWLAPLCAWALVVAVAWPVAVARELDFSWLALDAATPGGHWAGPPRLAAGAAVLGAGAQLVALLAFDWMHGQRDEDRARVWRWLAPGVGAACALAIGQASLAPAVFSREPWIALGRAAGPFYDANATGALAALFGPLLASRAAAGHQGSAGLRALLWIALSLAAVLASGSRASLAAWALATAGVLLTMAWRRRRPYLALGGAAVACALLVVTVAGGARFVAAGRLADTAEGALSGGPEALVEVLWNRYGYGPAAAAMFAEHRWTGVGPGLFGVFVTDYGRLATGQELMPDNAQNWWRHQLAELGLLGAAPSLACSWLALAAAVALLRRGTSARALALAGLGVLSFVSPPTQHPVLYALVGVLLAATIAEPGAGAGAPRSAAGPYWNAAMWLLAAATAAGLARDGLTAFRPAYRAARFHVEFHYGLGPLVSEEAGEGRWAASRAVGVFPPEGRTIVVGIALPHDDLAARPVRVSLSDRDGAVCDWTVRDRQPLECRIAVPQEDWPMVQLDIGRPWREDGEDRSALVTTRFEP